MNTPSAPRDTIDVDQIEVERLPEASFPKDVAAEYRVVIEAEAFRAIKEHSKADTTVELGGVLAGSLCKDDSGPFLLVKHAVPGIATKRTGSQVTFTHETWAHIHQNMEENYPDLSIVGWYHTHPGFGVFLSEMDVFIQEHFFNLPHQVAFVYDPLSEETGLFIWRNGKSVRQRHYWLAGTVRYDLDASAQSTPVNTKPPAGKGTRIPARDDAKAEAEKSPRRGGDLVEPPASSNLLWMAFGVLALMAAFWLGSSAARLAVLGQHDQTRAIETLIRSGLFRDDLGRQLTAVGEDLNQINRILQTGQSQSGRDSDVVRGAALVRSRTLVQDLHKKVAALKRAYTQADRLADRMSQVSRVGDDFRALAGELQTQRILLATLCESQASLLEKSGNKEDARTARDLLMLSKRLLRSEEQEKSGFLSFLKGLTTRDASQ